MTTTEHSIVAPTTYWSESQNASVENRGANFGRITVFHPGSSEVEAELTWAGKGRISHGNVTPTRDQKNRAIRALAESPWGEFALGVRVQGPRYTLPRKEEPVEPKHTPEEAHMVLALAEFKERLERADTTLTNMAELETDPARSAHCRSKAEGVRLALDYLRAVTDD